jgi:hypothetical protein
MSLMNATEKETYESGIESFRGTIPLWLVIVYVCLTIWGIFYLLTYWNGPANGP